MDMRVPANSIVPFDNNVEKYAHTIKSTVPFTQSMVPYSHPR